MAESISRGDFGRTQSAASLTVEDALRAYATMINTLNVSALEPLLADDFGYASQWVYDEIESKRDYMAYIVPKLQSIARSGQKAWAEMGWLAHTYLGPCVIVAQGGKDDLVGLVFAEVEHGRVKRLDLCAVPPPQAARRTGEYPGIAS